MYLCRKGKEIIDQNQQSVFLKIGAGENWHELVMHCVDNGWGGIENLSLIPGNTGTAPMQNIGAYGVEIKETFVELEALEISSGKIVKFNNSDCEFGYRESVFKNKMKNITMTDLKIYAINALAMGITTFTNLEIWLKIILLLVTIGYTVTKWIKLRSKK